MGRPTHVYFIREATLSALPIKETGQSLLNWATALLDEAEAYKEQDPFQRHLIFYNITEQIFENTDNCPFFDEPGADTNLENVGIQHITAFETIALWGEDIETTLYPKVSTSLQLRISDWRTNQARFPLNMETPLRKLLWRLRDISNFCLLEPHEIENLVTAAQEMMEELIFPDDWMRIIELHRRKSYDIAVLYYF